MTGQLFRKTKVLNDLNFSSILKSQKGDHTAKLNTGRKSNKERTKDTRDKVKDLNLI